MDELYTIIQNVGFPMALSVYLLIRFEKKIDLLNSSINELNKNIIKTLKK